MSKEENQYDILFTNQKIQLDNAITAAQAINNILIQALQNAVTVSNMVANNAAQASNLANNNAIHLSNVLNSAVVRHADLAADKQWNKDVAEMVADNVLLRGTDSPKG